MTPDRIAAIAAQLVRTHPSDGISDETQTRDIAALIRAVLAEAGIEVLEEPTW